MILYAGYVKVAPGKPQTGRVKFKISPGTGKAKFSLGEGENPLGWVLLGLFTEGCANLTRSSSRTERAAHDQTFDP